MGPTREPAESSSALHNRSDLEKGVSHSVTHPPVPSGIPCLPTSFSYSCTHTFLSLIPSLSLPFPVSFRNIPLGSNQSWLGPNTVGSWLGVVKHVCIMAGRSCSPLLPTNATKALSIIGMYQDMPDSRTWGLQGGLLNPCASCIKHPT